MTSYTRRRTSSQTTVCPRGARRGPQLVSSPARRSRIQTRTSRDQWTISRNSTPPSPGTSIQPTSCSSQRKVRLPICFGVRVGRSRILSCSHVPLYHMVILRIGKLRVRARESERQREKRGRERKKARAKERKKERTRARLVTRERPGGENSRRRTKRIGPPHAS